MQCQHSGRVGQQSWSVGCNHGHDEGVQTVGGRDVDVHSPARGQLDVRRVERIRRRQSLSRHHQPTTTNEFTDQRRLPVPPHAGSGRERVRLGERMQKLQQNGVRTERIHDGLHGCRVVQIAPGGSLRQQEVIADHCRQQGHVGGPQAEPVTDLNGEIGTDDAVVAAASLSDVVDERAEHQQIGTSDTCGQCTCVRGSFDQVSIHRPGVHRISRRQISNRTPFRNQPAPQSGSIERLDGRDGLAAGSQQHQQIVECFLGPRLTEFGGAVGQAVERGGRHRHAGLSRRCRNPHDQTRILVRSCVACQHHLTRVLDDSLVQRTANGYAT